MASMVVIAEVPTLSMVVVQERVATPFTWTVQAPQRAIPQPNFVPVMPSTSRNTHKRGVSPSTSTVRARPLTLIVVAIALSRLFTGLGMRRIDKITRATLLLPMTTLPIAPASSPPRPRVRRQCGALETPTLEWGSHAGIWRLATARWGDAVEGAE